MALLIKINMITGPSILSLKAIHPSVTQVRNLVELPIVWKRPTKIPWYDKRQTGDGVLKLEVDMARTPAIVEKTNELETANEEVKKLFTFHFLGRKFAMKRAQEEMVNSVKDHKYDRQSLGSKIAAETAIVRNLMEHFHQNPYQISTKVYLKEKIEKRNRKLGKLRKYDYKQFEWILDKLDLYYKPRPEVLDLVERKKSIRYLTDRYCQEYKDKKLLEYKEFLDSNKADFLKEKINSLEWIKKEELDCGAKPTVTDADIENAKKQLEVFLKSQETVEKKKSDNILDL